MLTCHSCKKRFPLVKDLLLHIRKNCFTHFRKWLAYKCGESGCFRQFTSLDAFRRHLKSKHENVTADINVEINSNHRSTPQPGPSSAGDNVNYDNVNDGVLEPLRFNIVAYEHSMRNVDLSEQLLAITSQFLASLYSNPAIPRSTVQVVVNGMQSFHQQLSENLQVKFLSLVKEGNTFDEVQSALKETLILLDECLEPLRSEYKRFQLFASLGTYISPMEVVLGYRRETLMKHNRLIITPRTCTMELIPLRNVLLKFFSIGTVLKETVEYLKELGGGATWGGEKNEERRYDTQEPNQCLENVMHGSAWLNLYKSPFLSNDPLTVVLPLVIFYDDFEISNVLGSHAGIHKLGGLYVSIPALPPHIVSQLNHTFMLSLCHSSDKTQFKNKKVFQPAIDELNYLHTTGITITTEFFTGVIKFKVVCLTGDNLGLNSILGFTESFVANHYCRICNAPKKCMQSMTIQNNELMRDMNSYLQQLEMKDVSKTGIKESCCWLELNGFDPFEHTAVDVMHDILEGTARYVMTFVINNLISRSMPHYNTLISKLVSFDYGPDSGSKPTSCIILEAANSVRIKTSAIEMLTLMRYFGLIAGYYVPVGDETWELYLALRKILERLLNHRVYSDTVEQLKYLIRDFNALYRQVSGETLKPKFHFLTHYPDMLLKFGPLRHVWTMRFEAKHRVSKMAARVVMFNFMKFIFL
ncbi:uncharacterized protein LOC116183029 [Photinus pyralis]|uniref:uncharacterized protein LOC116183029 n=1 Tax=Photinus pyralis TaxID=7054 RepID=UPI00126737B9|nr:uncharacterized protein LOC116183029 [Photinus pyralis]